MKLRREALGLPVMEAADRVMDALDRCGAVVVSAPPGAGKSTALPPLIYERVCGAGRVIMLEPRRAAARQLASRMAWLIGEEVGESVGYRVRFDKRVSKDTVIEVVTEGVMTRMMMDDSILEGVSALIFDEFHERSLVCDEAFALALQTRRLLRPDLRIVVMSATLDAAPLCEALDAPLVECEGRCFPVELRYAAGDSDERSCVADTAREILRAHRTLAGDILAFLPGEAEIRACAALLGDELGSTDVVPLYGMMPLEEQSRAIAPSQPGKWKVVIATPLAETSLTIEGVSVVVDSGFCRMQVFDSRSGRQHLETVRISRDMADQRAGRAGRVGPGVCVRLYTERCYRAMKPCRSPEILDADLVPMMLDIAAWGGAKVDELPWLTRPEDWKLKASRSVLQSIGALDQNGAITPEGRCIAAFPCHPRIAKMLLESERTASSASLASDLAAILEDRDPLASEDCGADIDLRVSALRSARRRGGGRGRWDRYIKAAEQFRRMVRAAEDDSEADPFEEGRLLAAAFPERIGKSSGEGYTLASGDTVRLERSDALAASEWIVAVSANVGREGTGRVFLAARLKPEVAAKVADTVDKITWDSREGCLVAKRERRIGAILLDSKPLQNVAPDRLSEALCDAARRYGESIFDFSDELANLQRRIAAVASWHPELSLPDVSTRAILDRAADWLPLYAGKSLSAAELSRIDMCAVVTGMLDYTQQQAVDRLAPSRITVPSGSSIKVEYRVGADAPVVRVRLQECFGLTDTPRVDGGRLPVVMELLSPGFKPVQLTSDLASFWSTTYFEVRKELRRRYPKHSWPDNPLEAQAVRGTGRKKNEL